MKVDDDGRCYSSTDSNHGYEGRPDSSGTRRICEKSLLRPLVPLAATANTTGLQDFKNKLSCGSCGKVKVIS